MSRMNSSTMWKKLSAAAVASVVAAAVAVPDARGVEPQTWLTSGVEEWGETARDSVSLDGSGRVAVSLRGSALEDPETLTVWALLADGEDVLAATGDPGIVYRIGRGGAVVEAGRVLQPEATALGRSRSGRVLVGTAPDGTVYRLAEGGAEQVADTPESYVWCFLPDGDRGMLFGTGNSGRIYRLAEGGNPQLVADPEVGHVTGMVRDGERVLLTTGAPARLIAMNAGGALEVLHETEDAELRSPVVSADGAMYFAGNEETGNGGTARLYRRLPSGAVDVVWSDSGRYAYGIAPAGEGSLWVTVGSQNGPGALIRVEPGPPSRWVESFRVDEPQALCLLTGRDGGVWLGTGGLGRVYRIEDAPAPGGTVRSTVHDAGVVSRWGAVTVEPGPARSGIVVETRSGNTRRPGDLWSSWKRVSLEDGAGQVEAPPGRFLQWRLSLTEPEARVGGIRVMYLPANRAPRVSEVAISELGQTFERTADRGQLGGLAQELPGGIRVEFQMNGGGGSPGPADDPDAAWARRFRTVTWKANDPNDDPLRFSVSLRPQGEQAWNELAADLERSPWVWDSATVPDGWYELRINATDATGNAEGDALEAARVSDAFLVDNTPPVVRDLECGAEACRGTAEDASSAIKRLEFSVDGGAWKRVYPADGLPDSRRERFELPLRDLSPGDHVILVRAVDRAGNIGSGQRRITAR